MNPRFTKKGGEAMNVSWTEADARNFSMNAKRRRLELGLSQEEIARKAGVSRASYNYLETRPKRNIHIGTALSIARALDTTVEVLISS